MHAPDEHFEEMAAFFDRRAEGYDAHMREAVEDFDAFYNAVAAIVTPTGAPIRILDLGAGTGAELGGIFRRAPRARWKVGHTGSSRCCARRWGLRDTGHAQLDGRRRGSVRRPQDTLHGDGRGRRHLLTDARCAAERQPARASLPGGATELAQV